MSRSLFKVLNPDRTSFHGGNGSWPEIGEWIEVKGELVPCQNGLHLCREQDLIEWIGPAIFTAEYDGEMIKADDKIVVRRARLTGTTAWNERAARLFACDCAERVLHLYESRHPHDNRVRNCIEIAREVANGSLPASELAAARDAAWAAARNAARDAARDAAWAAARDAARAATWDAARDAARDATWDAAWAATWDAEREWQATRLLEYVNGSAQ